MILEKNSFKVPQIPNLATLQKIKSESKLRKRFNENEFASLWMITNLIKYFGSLPIIKVIEGGKLVVFILTNHQISRHHQGRLRGAKQIFSLLSLCNDLNDNNQL